MIAFCSACRPRQSSCLSPDGTFNFSRRHPVISQCVMPVGVPLYPVVRILLFFTIKAPTARLRQAERSDRNFQLLAKAPCYLAMRDAGRCPVVSGRQDPSVLFY